MGRRWIAVCLALLALGVALALGPRALRDDQTRAQTFGVLPMRPVATIKPRAMACESPVGLAEPVDLMTISAGAGVGVGARPSPPLEVIIRGTSGHSVLATGRLAGGYRSPSTNLVTLSRRVGTGSFVDVCVRNVGHVPADLHGDVYQGDLREALANITGGGRPTLSTAGLTVNGGSVPGDIAVDFYRDHPRTLLSLVGEMFERAGRFKAGAIGAWTFWALLGLVLVAAPVLLVRAVRLAADAD